MTNFIPVVDRGRSAITRQYGKCPLEICDGPQVVTLSSVIDFTETFSVMMSSHCGEDDDGILLGCDAMPIRM